MVKKYIGALIGFLIGLGGEFLASFLQDGIWKEGFGFLDIAIILILTLIGLYASVKLDSNLDSENDDSVNVSRLKAFWSKIKLRGRNIKLRKILSIKSKIDIDSKK